MASFQIDPPEAFTFATPNEWPSWKKRFLRYRTASGLQAAAEERQVDTLVYLMGTQAEDIFNTFKLSTENAKKFDVVLAHYEAYFFPKRNIIYERARFNTRTQGESESVEEFSTALHTLADTCNFGELREELIRDRLVVGLQDKKVSEKLQLDSSLDLMKALMVARQHETVRQQQKELRPTESPESVHQVHTSRSFTVPQKAAVAWDRTLSKRHQHDAKNPERSCTWCGHETHSRASCPAKDAVCRGCGKRGHFMTVCRSTSSLRNVTEQGEGFFSKGHLMTASGPATQTRNDGQEPGFLGTTSNSQTSKWELMILVENHPVLFKVDTGADETVIPEDLFRSLFKDPTLNPPRRQLQGPDGRRLHVLGVANLNLSFKNYRNEEEVYVLRGLKTPLLGRPAIEKLKVLPEICQVRSLCPEEEFPCLFEGLGTMKGDYEVKLAPDATAFALTSPRRVPLPLFNKTKMELERMQQLGVISPVTEPVAWCAPMVVVPKPSGAIRICVDFTQLNKYVQRDWHPIPSVKHTLGML